MSEADARLQCDGCREWYLPDALTMGEAATVWCPGCVEDARDVADALLGRMGIPPLPPGVEVRQATDAEQREALEQAVGRRRPPRFYSRRQVLDATRPPPPDMAELALVARRINRALHRSLDAEWRQMLEREARWLGPILPPVRPRAIRKRARAVADAAWAVGWILLAALLCIAAAWLVGPR